MKIEFYRQSCAGWHVGVMIQCHDVNFIILMPNWWPFIKCWVEVKMFFNKSIDINRVPCVLCTLLPTGLMTFGNQKENIKQDKRDSETFILQKVKHKFCIAINYAKKDSIFDKNSPPLLCATLMEYLSCKNSQVKIGDINNVLTDRYSLAGGILITFIQPLNSGNGMRGPSPLSSRSLPICLPARISWPDSDPRLGGQTCPEKMIKMIETQLTCQFYWISSFFGRINTHTCTKEFYYSPFWQNDSWWCFYYHVMII